MSKEWNIRKLFEDLYKDVRLPALPPMKLDLIYAMQDPNLQIYSDDDVVVIKDKCPKAQIHFLVLPKTDIPSIKTVKYEHYETLKKMDRVAKELAKETGEDRNFWFGYHAWQSQLRLHLHAISQDLLGVGMNTVGHWNSFTTPFFMHSKDILRQLKRGYMKVPSRKECLRWLGRPIICHICKCYVGDVYLLKDHIKEQHIIRCEHIPCLGNVSK